MKSVKWKYWNLKSETLQGWGHVLTYLMYPSMHFKLTLLQKSVQRCSVKCSWKKKKNPALSHDSASVFCCIYCIFSMFLKSQKHANGSIRQWLQFAVYSIIIDQSLLISSFINPGPGNFILLQQQRENAIQYNVTRYDISRYEMRQNIGYERH